MGPRPSFQYRRSSVLPTHQVFHATSNTTPLPPRLQEVTNIPRPSMNALSHNPPDSRRLSVSAPVAKKKPRGKKAARAPYRQIQSGLSEDLRLKMLVEAVMRREYETHYADVSQEERERFEEGMLEMSKFLDSIHADAEKNDPGNAERTRPNNANENLRKRIFQLEEIVKNYKLELEKWGDVQKEGAKISEVPPLPEESTLELPAGLPKPSDLMKSSADAIETYILQTDHLRNMLSKLQSQDRETRSRVQAVAAALNQRVMTSLGRKSTGNLTPPANLATVSVNENDL